MAHARALSGATTASAHAWRDARGGCACRELFANSLSSVPAGLFDHTTALSYLWVEQQLRGRIAVRVRVGRVCARVVRLYVPHGRRAGVGVRAGSHARAHAHTHV